MQAPQPRITGTRDYAGDDAVALRTARLAIEAMLRSYAYAPIDPPILERSAPFLNRSGEDIRRHMYIFADPGGREVCLRPELTIPVCRAFLRQLQSPEGEAEFSPRHEARLCYFGPAFRYESTSAGQYRQFYQAGAEFIGAKWREAADAEILAVAVQSLNAAGIADANVAMGDVDILNAFIERVPAGERSKARLRRLALGNLKETRLSSALENQEAAAEEANEFGELASLLASVEPGKAELLIKEILALADVRHVGGRTPEEIVERLTSRSARQLAEPVSAELLQGVAELLHIRGEPAAAFAAVRESFRKFGIASVDDVLERCESRLRYFAAYGLDGAAVDFNVGLRRGLEYYTGFLFDIFARDQPQLGPVCGGGRYDNLLEGLGANAPIPAVGFAIGLDRVLAVLQRAQDEDASEARGLDAFVVAATAGAHEECVRAATALRRAVWSVETDTSGIEARDAMDYARQRKFSHVVFVGGDASQAGQVRVLRPEDGSERRVALSGLEDFAQAERARPPGRAT